MSSSCVCVLLAENDSFSATKAWTQSFVQCTQCPSNIPFVPTGNGLSSILLQPGSCTNLCTPSGDTSGWYWGELKMVRLREVFCCGGRSIELHFDVWCAH